MRLGSLDIRWEAFALAAVLLTSMAAWSWRLRVIPGGREAEDLLYVLLAIVPGAVVGGRLVHALAFADVYVAEPTALLDLSRGAISLAGAVLGGTLAGIYVCRLLGREVGHWAGAAAWPLLLAVGLGKLTLLLSGSGQGMPFDGASAIAFDGPGPWVSADPATPAHPAQLYEGLWTLAGIPVVARLAGERRAAGGGGVGGGHLYLLAVLWWLLGRSLAGLTWRDELRIGPLGVEQALSVAMLAVIAAFLALHDGGPRERVTGD